MATKDVGNLRTRLAWEDDGAIRSLTRFRDDLKGLRSEMRTITSQGKDYANSLKGLRQQQDILTRQMKTEKEHLKDLKKRYDEVSEAKGEDSKSARELARQYNQTQAYLNETERELKRVTEAIEQQTNPWKRLANEAEAAGKKMQSIGRSMTDFGRNYSMKVTASIVGTGTAAFKAAMDFESAFAGVIKTVDGTDKQLSDLRQGIRDMAKEIPASTTEIAEVAEAAGQLGIEVENIKDFTRVMIDLGNSTNLSASQGATEFARFANIVGMSQKDFDRLGSTIVELGNNMATTEAEISEMALRLAGAGKQIGLTESDILAFAASLSSVGIEAEAGGSAFSKVMVKMQLAAERGGKDLQAFASVAGVSANDFKKAFSEDATNAILMFIKGLSTAEDRGLSAIGILDEMGITEVRMRDALLRASGASDTFTKAIDMGSKAWKENTALTKEAETRYGTTESQLKIMWNRVKDVAITLGESLAPAVMDAIDAAEPFIKQIESGAKAFSELDEEQQRTILKMIGLVAAIGPASMALGGMTSTVGGLTRGLGSVVGLFGKVGGKGLLGGIGSLGLTGPVGLAVAGVGALGLGIYTLSKHAKANTEEIVANTEKRLEELNALDASIERYEELQKKNKLSTDEVLRYMDIMDELDKAKSEETIARLTKEQEALREKSGLSNEELQEFLDLNDSLVQNAPQTAQAISEQGNAYLEVSEKVKELSRAEREREATNLYATITAQMDQQLKDLEKQAKLEEEINGLKASRNAEMEKINASGQRLLEIDREINGINLEELGITIEEREARKQKVAELEAERGIHESIVQFGNEEISSLDKQIDKEQKKLDEVNAQVDAYNTMVKQYESLLLYQKGIVDEQGRSYESIVDAKAALHEQRMEQIRLKNAGEITNEEYEKAIANINKQEDAVESVQGEVDVLNKKLGEKITKNLDIKTKPTLGQLEKELMKPATRKLLIDTKYRNIGAVPMPAYAKGTSNHPGGPFLAGEEGFEIGKFGNRLELLNLGIYNRKPGYQVFPHDESKRIMQALNRLPAYSDGAIPTGETNRLINQLNNQQQKTGEVVIYTTVINQMNGREISREIYRDVTKFQTMDKEMRESFA